MNFDKRIAARTILGTLLVEKAAEGRHPIPDSDLYDEQPVTVSVSTSLGALRRAGLSEFYKERA